MIDTYLKSKNKAALDELRAFAVNVMTATQGRTAQDAYTDENGEHEATSVAGDPEYFYTCVRFCLPLSPYGEVEACDTETGILVCGLWKIKSF